MSSNVIQFGHGGARPGAGRPKSESGPGEKIGGSMDRLALAILDASRGEKTRIEQLEELIWAAYERGDLLPAGAIPGRRARRKREPKKSKQPR